MLCTHGAKSGLEYKFVFLLSQMPNESITYFFNVAEWGLTNSEEIHIILLTGVQSIIERGLL